MSIDIGKVEFGPTVEWMNTVVQEKGEAYAEAVRNISVKRAEIWEAKNRGEDVKADERHLALAITLYVGQQTIDAPEKMKEYARGLLDDSDKLVELGRVALEKYRREFDEPEPGVGYGGTA